MRLVAASQLDAAMRGAAATAAAAAGRAAVATSRAGKWPHMLFSRCLAHQPEQLA